MPLPCRAGVEAHVDAKDINTATQMAWQWSTFSYKAVAYKTFGGEGRDALYRCS
jgi:hypothetical protein